MNEQPRFDADQQDQISADAPARTERLSDLLERLAGEGRERISIRYMAEALEDRSFGAFLIVFALPNLMPLPPGATLLIGVPVLVITWQIAAGREKVWLPSFIADYSFERDSFVRLVERANPWLRRAETWIRPRAWVLGSRTAERLFGLYALLIAIILVIPIPFGNWLPAFAIAVMGAAFAERDGYCLGIGAAIGLLSLTIVMLIVTALGALLAAAF